MMIFYMKVVRKGQTDGTMQCPYDDKQIWITAYTSNALKKLKRKITGSWLRCPHCKKGMILEFQKGEE